MPRLPEEEIERLKRETSLVALVEASGVILKPHGNNLLGLCPFHDDHEPSLVVTPTKNLWHCLGACQQGGSVIDWVMKWNGVSFRHAVELLRNDPSLAASSSRPLKISRVRRLPSPVSLDVEDQQLLNQVIGYYHDTLKQSPEALAYLEKRGLQNSEIIERFKLGYANRTLGLRLPVKATKPGKEIRARLERLGLFRESGHEHFTGSLVIPILDESGNVTEAYGRKIRDDLKAGTPLHLYLPGPHQGVWNLEALHASKEIILCEALIDALTFWCAGYRNVIASYGVEGFTADHLAAFKRYGTERVLIAYDRDDAGEQAAQKLAEKLIAEGIDCYRLHFPKGMDANEYALHVQPAEKSLGVVIHAATWLGKGAGRPREGEAMIVENNTATGNDETDNEPSSPLAAEFAATSTESLTASPVTPPKADIEAVVAGDTVTIAIGDRSYRVRGLAQNLSLNQMKVNVFVRRADAFHVDQVELHSARQRALYAAQAAKELNIKEDVIHKDLGKLFLKLEELREQNIEQALAPKQKAVELNDTEKQAALALLKDAKLLDRILADFHACGVVGEETNKLVGYLAATSRKLDKPLAVIVQSTSAAGKSSLMDAVLAFVPEEERIQYSAMTGQALYYMGSIELKHKVLALSEEQGASRAAYAIKLLQSEGKLTIASTGKNPETGELVTKDYTVEGPVMIFMTTTAIDLDDELLNRCLVLAVDEDREQTKAIHHLQREAETLEGLIAKEERSHLLTLHQNAQRLLKPLRVVNPYARHLTFPDTATRTRRDHTKYLALIRAVAFLHQHQRTIKTMTHRGETSEYIEATLDDIEIANRLAHDVLGRTLDELPPQPRRLLWLLDQMVREACARLKMDRPDYRFSRREVRAFTQWGDTQCRLHLDRLVDLEYVLVHRGGRGQSFVYELLYDGQGKDGKPFVPGLFGVEQLRSATTTKSSRGSEGEFAGSSRPQRGPIAGGSRPIGNDENTGNPSTDPASGGEEAKNALPDEEKSAASYTQKKPKKQAA
jgi:DNA primase